MIDQVYENIEIASESTVKQAARDFAAAVAETPQFIAFEKAAYAFRNDQAAQQAMIALQQKQQSLRPLMQLNALNNMQREELMELQTCLYQPGSGPRILLRPSRTDYIVPGVR